MVDPFLWLEERHGTEPVLWVEQQNKISATVFEEDSRYASCWQRALDLLTTPDKLPVVTIRDGLIYNFWQDEKHVRGLWRRTSLPEFKKENPVWELLLDVDELAAREQEPWVFQGADISPSRQRCLLFLSRDGQDASVKREYSLKDKQFVTDGFFIPESKSGATWFDEDRLLVAFAVTESQKTEAGYSQEVRTWKRGQAPEQAVLLLQGQKKDLSTYAYSGEENGKKHFFIGRALDFQNSENFVLKENHLEKMPLPTTALLQDVFQDRAFYQLTYAWEGFNAGTLIAVPLHLAGKTCIGAKDVEVVYRPKQRESLSDIRHTQDRLYLNIFKNIRGEIHEAVRNPQGEWILKQVSPNEGAHFIFVFADRTGDTVIVQESGALQPTRLLALCEEQWTVLKSSRSYFQEDRFVTEILWARSKDGTEIPYSIIRAKDLNYSGQNPTLLYGYGGFLITKMPNYSGMTGQQWLEQGGIYVIAHIRGGGEFGPEWHLSAIKENKQRSYDDFISVAEDLIARKITSPRHLGIQGGSNGGLLVGAVTMQRPDLFNAVVCQIPLLDMIRYTKLPPGSAWIAEYGDPEDPKMRDVILKYSPYQNISATKKYPKMYFQTTRADDRVQPAHARKMVALMLEKGHEVLYYEPADGGHGGGGVKPEDQAKAFAYVFVYLYQQLMPKL